MIKQIHKLALSCASINILVLAKENGGLSLTFVPNAKPGADPALAAPFTLSGTPEELEAGIEGALAKIAGARESLADQIEATTAVIEMATKNSAAKGAKALQGKPSKQSPKVGGEPACNDEGDDDLDTDGDDSPANSSPVSDGAATSVAAAGDGGAAQAKPAMNLFA